MWSGWMVVQVKENEKEDALMDVTRTQKQAADLRRQLDDTQVASSFGIRSEWRGGLR